MGTGSRNYGWYYAFGGLIYLGISIASFISIGNNKNFCQSQCPLQIPSTAKFNYSACACYSTNNGVTDYQANGWENFSQMIANNQTARFIAIHDMWYKDNIRCFICSTNSKSSTVYSPCQTQQHCNSDGLSGFRSGGVEPNSQCSLLTSATVTLRGTIVSVLYAFAVFYLLMGLACILISFGFFCFMDKWEDDFAKLNRWETAMGFIAKNFPVVVRICNLLVVFFLIFSLVIIFGYDVCETDLNANGEEAFYKDVSALVIAVTTVWGLSCVAGTLFNRCVPHDTPFYAPKHPTDQRDGRCYRCLVNTGYFVLRSGP
mmetsp:Transcript_19279/g.31692  ORF Transcript_19279/g.31692 Transcript_19279/m.31692 type:complete len:316 (+) Transcript_19279:171-1118(+)